MENKIFKWNDFYNTKQALVVLRDSGTTAK